ncbi:MAG: hypothetical protein EPN91_05670 [Salinibacterium sp.]|nr:MAG: hypothetical protein EPN91_05670 [Salinibacterium sp.]
MSFQWPSSKIDVINSALTSTGDNIVTAADNGSDEWNICSNTYETSLAYIMESHGWGYATQVAVLQPSPTPPQDSNWDTAYPLPNDCIHIIWAKINQDVASALGSSQPVLTLYKIMGTPTGPVLVINAQGGPPPPNPPQTPAQVTIKYISNSGALCDSTNGTPTMIVALQTYVMSGIYRALHEDVTEADRVYQGAERLLQQARTRYDQQLPKRQFFNSRITASRRIRRPWPQMGNNSWGGSNTPG